MLKLVMVEKFRLMKLGCLWCWVVRCVLMFSLF